MAQDLNILMRENTVQGSFGLKKGKIFRAQHFQWLKYDFTPIKIKSSRHINNKVLYTG